MYPFIPERSPPTDICISVTFDNQRCAGEGTFEKRECQNGEIKLNERDREEEYANSLRENERQFGTSV